MRNPVNWFQIHVQDMDRARSFYEAVFGVKLTRLANTEHEMFSFPSDMNGYGASGALSRIPGVPSGGGGTLVYFSCEDCAVEAERAARAGGSIRQPKMSIGEYGAAALVQDTEGNLIGLHSMK
jgi:predicted enzyme related to lactoylglutathione lyase